MSLAAVARWVSRALLVATLAAAPPLASPVSAQSVCTEDATRCTQGRFERCQRGRWVTVQTCRAGQSCTVEQGCVTARIQRPAPTRERAPVLQRQAPRVVGPGVIPQSGGLTCPAVPHNPVTLPAPPYDEAQGDCALRGHATRIEDWLSALESIAATCQARRAGYWQATLDGHANLLAQIDALPLPPEPSSESELSLGPMEAMCDPYSSAPEPLEPAEPLPRDGWEYTDALKRIGEDVVTYCGLVDRLIESVFQACDEIDHYLGCQPMSEARRTSYHSLANAKWHPAELRYEYTDFFYTHTLGLYGWQSFRATFSESAIRCPGNLDCGPVSP
jgi:hypothetical protein